MARMALRRRAAGDTGETIYRGSLRAVRERLGIRQSDLATMLATTQPAVLKTENSADLRVSTIRRYIDGLARARQTTHDLRIIARIGRDEYEILLPQADRVPAGDRMPQSTRPGPAASTSVNGRWRLRAWDSEMLEREWLRRELVAVSRDEIGDLTTWPGDDEVLRRLRCALPERSAQACGTFLTYWRYFRLEMQPDDLVLVPLTQRQVGLARIVGDYRYAGDEPNEFLRHVRPVRWLRQCARADIDEHLRSVVNAPGTICRVAASFPDEWWTL